VGKAAYVAQAARELFRYPFPRFAASLDGAGEEGVASAIVSKGRLYAGRHLLAPGAVPGEPGFRVALFRGGGPARAALCGAALPLGLLPRLPGVEIRRVSRVRLAAAPGGAVPAQADGDPAGLLPVEIEDAPGPLRVVLPAGGAPISPSSPSSSSPRPSPP